MLLTKNALQVLVDTGLAVNKNNVVQVDVSSVGLRLDNQFTVYDPYEGEPFTPPKAMPSTTKTISPDDFFVLPPNGCVLACTQEYVTMPRDKFGLIQTKGSIARGFISVHMSDGQIDPGYKGKVTLELVNMSPFYYKLVPGMPIASLFVINTDENVEPYDGRYQSSSGPTAMK
ncbi:dCTP deaminase [Marinomonas sp.]|jgi:dCTP deaminase|uniref:dCTP deaminase n=1 Tax=Marinomonas sp. TaxID=1904862 RepID=UPI003BAAE7E6